MLPADHTSWLRHQAIPFRRSRTSNPQARCSAKRPRSAEIDVYYVCCLLKEMVALSGCSSRHNDPRVQRGATVGVQSSGPYIAGHITTHAMVVAANMKPSYHRAPKASSKSTRGVALA